MAYDETESTHRDINAMVLALEQQLARLEQQVYVFDNLGLAAEHLWLTLATGSDRVNLDKRAWLTSTSGDTRRYMIHNPLFGIAIAKVILDQRRAYHEGQGHLFIQHIEDVPGSVYPGIRLTGPNLERLGGRAVAMTFWIDGEEGLADSPPSAILDEITIASSLDNKGLGRTTGG